MRVLDLFSGIGGFSLGLERAGMRTVAFCEIDPYCQRVLRKHWPDVPVFGDIAKLSGAEVISVTNAKRRERRQDDQGQIAPERNGHTAAGIDLICGGFPCQDISVAGKGAGIEGERSGLWTEYARVIGELRPRYIIVENVAALLGRGLSTVLGDLAALGYDAEWHCIPASAVGAPHRRDRVWIVAYAQERAERAGLPPAEADDDGRWDGSADRGCDIPDTTGSRFQEWHGILTRGQVADAATAASAWWLIEPDVGRVAHGVPARVDRLRGLGNAIVPQIAEIIGRAIMDKAS